jgi:hypothetical protein
VCQLVHMTCVSQINASISCCEIQEAIRNISGIRCTRGQVQGVLPGRRMPFQLQIDSLAVVEPFHSNWYPIINHIRMHYENAQPAAATTVCFCLSPRKHTNSHQLSTVSFHSLFSESGCLTGCCLKHKRRQVVMKHRDNRMLRQGSDTLIARRLHQIFSILCAGLSQKSMLRMRPA